jgi:low temperature requirement protein LtrA
MDILAFLTAGFHSGRMSLSVTEILTPLMRRRDKEEDGRVSTLELFFDLVFVFAITQISHYLLEHFTVLGLLQTAMLVMAVWWVWVYTSWATNWLNPDTRPVRLMLIVLMLFGVVLAASVPEAFGSRGLAFAGAYVAMQVGRTAFALWAMWNSHQRQNFSRILCWLILGGLLWLAGGVAHGEARLALWALALFIDYAGPTEGYWTPGLGRSTTHDWSISGQHMSERAGLFIIIALGESILVTGATFAELDWTPLSFAALAVTFAGSVALWWIYFVANAEAGAQSISHSDDPGRIARVAYTFIHLTIVAGIVLTAVGDEFILAHPSGHTDLKTALAVLGGPLLFLLGNLLFKRVITGHIPVTHVAGMAALTLGFWLATLLSPVLLGLMVTAVLVLVALWETQLGHRTEHNSGRREKV